MTTFIIVPIIFLILGITFIIYPKQSGLIFCRLGKLNWKIITFGITDMHWFYKEDSAPSTFRILGFGFSFFALFFLVVLLLLGGDLSDTLSEGSRYSELSKNALLEYLDFDTTQNYRIRERGGRYSPNYGKPEGHSSFVISQGRENRYYRLEWTDSTQDSYTVLSIFETPWVEGTNLDTIFLRVEDSTETVSDN